MAQGSLPTFDTLDADGSQTTIQRKGYHDGGPPSNDQINTDEIINSIGYGPLQVSVHAEWKWSSSVDLDV